MPAKKLIAPTKRVSRVQKVSREFSGIPVGPKTGKFKAQRAERAKDLKYIRKAIKGKYGQGYGSISRGRKSVRSPHYLVSEPKTRQWGFAKSGKTLPVPI